jgi:hypothetical protein
MKDVHNFKIISIFAQSTMCRPLYRLTKIPIGAKLGSEFRFKSALWTHSKKSVFFIVQCKLLAFGWPEDSLSVAMEHLLEIPK